MTKYIELLEMKPDFGPTTIAAFGANARRPAYSVLAHDRFDKLTTGKLKQPGMDELRPWPEALFSYLGSKKSGREETRYGG